MTVVGSGELNWAPNLGSSCSGWGVIASAIGTSTDWPFTPTIFSTCFGPVSVPSTLTRRPSLHATTTSTTLRYSSLRSSADRSLVTPRDSAITGALTKVTCSLTIEEKKPLSAASRSTFTS